MLDFLNITKALTDENRLRVLMALRGRELCVCQITGFLDLAPSTTSKHLSVLKQARLIESHKRGKWVYYNLPDPQPIPEGADKSFGLVAQQARIALGWVMSSLERHPMILEDEERIRKMLELEKEMSAGNSDSYHSLEIHYLQMQDEKETTNLQE